MRIKLFRPRTIDETLEILGGIRGKRFFLAGGTDLLVQAKDGVIPKSSWIDLSAVKELLGIREDPPTQEHPEGSLFIGSRSTFDDCMTSPLVARYIPALPPACALVGGPQIRMMGTIGGNLGNASPVADSVPPLVALDAELTLASPRGRRSVPVAGFARAPRKTVLASDEVILGARIPKRRNVRGHFIRLGQRSAQAISKVSIAVHLEMDGDRHPSFLRIALGAVAPTVIRAPRAEALLLERGLVPDAIQEAKRIIMEEAVPIDDIRSTKDYRRAMCGVLLERAFALLR